MNVRLYALLVVAAVLISRPIFAETPEKATLRDVRYSVVDGTSRVTVLFDTPVFPRIQREERTVLLVIPATVVASPPGAARLVFRSGIVQSLRIDRLSGDSCRLTIGVREPVIFRLVEAGDRRRLTLEFNPAGSTTSTALGAEEDRNDPNEKAEQEKTLSGLIEMPTTPAPDTDEQIGWPLPLISLAIIIILGALALLRLYIKYRFAIAHRKPARALRAVSLSQEAEISSPKKENGPDEGVLHPTEPLSHHELEGLARTFQRGRGEVDLVARFSNRAKGEAITRAIASERTIQSSKEIRIAKELGVGVGEINLARHLRDAQAGHTHRRGTS